MKIFCIGRNYAKHAKELGNAIPAKPLVFMKPASALLVNGKDFYYPEFTKDLHYELEVVLKIAKNGKHIQPEFAKEYFNEISLGIDFTARDLQQKCKEKGHPWEIAKAFDSSAVIGDFVSLEEATTNGQIEFMLNKNGQQVQHGMTNDLIFPFEELIVYLSQYFKLQKGDYIYTGTPAGVGPVTIGDQLEGVLMTKDGAKTLMNCKVK